MFRGSPGVLFGDLGSARWSKQSMSGMKGDVVEVTSGGRIDGIE